MFDWLSDFAKGLWTTSKNNWELWTTETPEESKIKWYKQLSSWEIVWVREDPSWWEKAWETIRSWLDWVANAATQFWDNNPWRWDKQEIDNAIIWLRKDWQELSWQQSQEYIDKVWQYQYLQNKPNKTFDDYIELNSLDSELKKYEVPDFDNNDEADIAEWLAWILPDSWRHEAAQWSKTYKKVDLDNITWLLNDRDRLYNYYSSPTTWVVKTQAQRRGDTDNSGSAMRFLTDDELAKEKETLDINSVIENKVSEVVDRLKNNKDFKITGEEWEIINEDTIRWVLETAMSVRSVSTTLEAYKELDRRLDEATTPTLKKLVESKMEDMIDMLWYQLEHWTDSEQAYLEYSREHWSPNNLDYSSVYDNMNDYEKWLVSMSESVLWFIPTWYQDYWLLWGADWYYKADMLLRTIDYVNHWWWWVGNYFKRVWDMWMLTSAQTGWLLQEAVWFILWWVDYAKDLLTTWEVTMDDFKNYLYWWQNPDAYTVKEKTQQWMYPQNGSDRYWMIFKENIWMADEVFMAYRTMKFNLPVKSATIKNLSKVYPKLNTLAKNAQKTEKVVEAVDKAEDVASWASKAGKAAKAWETAAEWTSTASKTKSMADVWAKIAEDASPKTFMQRVKDWYNSLINGMKSARDKRNALNAAVKTADKMIDMDTSTKAMLLWENVLRWAAEETFTSMWFQWMTPYEYQAQDLALDIAWAAWSWFLRTREYMNATGMMKYKAVSNNKVWWVWYIKEAMWVSAKEAEDIISKLTDLDLEDIWWAVMQQMWDMIWDTEALTKTWFKSKFSKISEAWRQGIRQATDKLVKQADDMLINKLRNSSNSKYTSMVKKVTTIWPDWKKTSVWTFNKPKWMAESTWQKKLNDARRKAYAPGWLDWYKNEIKALDNIRQYVKNNFAKLLAEESTKYVTKVNWKRELKPKYKNDKKLIKKLMSNLVHKRMTQLWYYMWRGKATKKAYKTSAVFKNKVFKKLYDLWLWDENENPLGYYWRLLAYHVNNIIMNWEYDKSAIVSSLDWYWKAISWCFVYWLKKQKWISDYRTLSKKELFSSIIEFWHTLDEKTFWEYLIEEKVFNTTWMWTDRSSMLINQSFEKACEYNPDLRWMWVVMFSKIARDMDVPELQRELKLRSYKKCAAKEWNHFVWILRDWLHVWWVFWTKVFWDNFEEKKMMWTSWRINLKLSNKSQSEALDTHIWFKAINPEWEWVYNLKYEVGRPVNKTRDWEVWYELRNEDNERVWWLVTYWDNIQWWDPKKVWQYDRYMYIKLDWKEFEDVDFQTATFDIFRDSWDWKERFVRDYDISRNMTDETRTITDSELNPNRLKEQEWPTLKEWNSVVNHIAYEWNPSRASWWKFIKLIPWRTDRVPYEYYKNVMEQLKNRNLVKDRFNLLLNMMYNDYVTQTDVGVKIDLWTHHNYQFKSTTHNSYIFVTHDEGKTFDREMVVVPGDWQMLMMWRSNWAAIVQLDPKWEMKEYIYIKDWRRPDTYILFEATDKELKKPAWEFMIWEKKMLAYVYNWKNRVRVKWSIEILDDGSASSISKARKTIDERIRDYWIEWRVKIEWDSIELYDEISQSLFWKWLSDKERVSLRSIPWMTPERYFNNVVDSFLSSRFWRYMYINKNRSWKEIAEEIRQANTVIKKAEAYANAHPNLKVTDEQLLETILRCEERMALEWDINLTPEEIDVKNILYPKKKGKLSSNEFIDLTLYKEYWEIPSTANWPTQVRARARRDRILTHMLRDKDVSWMDEDTKVTFVSMMSRNWWFYKTDEQLDLDIRQHPEEYKMLLQDFSEFLRKKEESLDTKGIDKRIKWIQKKIDKLKAKLPKWKRKFVEGKNTKKFRKTLFDVTHSIMNAELEVTRWQLEEVLERFAAIDPTVDPELYEATKKSIEDLRQKIADLERWDYLFKETSHYREDVSDDIAITPEQWNKMVSREVRWLNPWYKTQAMTESEVELRIRQLTSNNRMQNVRVLRYDPVTWEIDSSLLTENEKIQYKNLLNQAAEWIRNWQATAAHIAELHAIVIDPTNLNQMDIWHEWFHEAINLMWMNWKAGDVLVNTYNKYWKIIEENAVNLWYDKQYANLSQQQYKMKITEEWLAERFWEYINGKFYWELSDFEDWFIWRFFKELWDKIQLMFSDTEIVDFFDEIYYWVDKHNELKIDLNASNIEPVWWVSNRLISQAAHDRYQDWNLWFEVWDFLWIARPTWEWWTRWNDLSNLFNHISGIYDDPQDILVWLWYDFTWRWNIFWSIKQPLNISDWTILNASYSDIYEALISESNNLISEIAAKALYWWESSWYEKTINDIFDRIKYWWDPNIVESYNVAPWLKITVETVTNNWNIELTTKVWNMTAYNIKWNAGKWLEDFRSRVLWALTDWHSEKRNVFRVLDWWSAVNSWLWLTNQAMLESISWSLNSVIVNWKTIPVKEAIKLMWESLWRSLKNNYRIIVDPSLSNFNQFAHDIWDDIFLTYLYDRMIPHVWNSRLENTVFNELYNIKNDKTENIIKYIAFSKNNWIPWSDLWKWDIWADTHWKPAVTFTVNTWWAKRAIWRHFKDKYEAYTLLQNLVAEWYISQSKANRYIRDINGSYVLQHKLYFPSIWNVSMFSMDDETFNSYKDVIWFDPKKNYREWYNNNKWWSAWTVKFRNSNTKQVVYNKGWVNMAAEFKYDDSEIPDIDWSLNIPKFLTEWDNTIYFIWQDKIPIIVDNKDPWVIITKWVNSDALEWLIHKWYWISSSSAVSKTWSRWRWEHTLIWKKIQTDPSRALYWNMTLWVWDWASPVWNGVRLYTIRWIVNNVIADMFYRLWSGWESFKMLFDDISNWNKYVLDDINNKLDELFDSSWLSLEVKDWFKKAFANYSEWEWDTIYDKVLWSFENIIYNWRADEAWELMDLSEWFTRRIDENINRLVDDDALMAYLNNHQEVLDEYYHRLWDEYAGWKDKIQSRFIDTKTLNYIENWYKDRLVDDKWVWPKWLLEWLKLFYKDVSSYSNFLSKDVDVWWKEWLQDYTKIKEQFVKFLEENHSKDPIIEEAYNVYKSMDPDAFDEAMYYNSLVHMMQNSAGTLMYYEIYSHDVKASDYWWIATTNPDFTIKTLTDNWYRYAIAEDWMTKEDMEALYKSIAWEDWKWYVIFNVDPYQLRWLPNVDVNELNKVNLRRTRNWTKEEDLDAAKDLWIDVPITLISSDKYVQDMHEINRIRAKYWLSIWMASPEQKKLLDKWKWIDNTDIKAARNSAMYRQTKMKINKLNDSLNILNWIKKRRLLQLQEFQESPLYKQIDHIWQVLKQDEELKNAVKNADISSDKVATYDTKMSPHKASVTPWATTTSLPPLWTLYDWITSITNKHMIDSIWKNIKWTDYDPNEVRAVWLHTDRKIFVVTDAAMSYWVLDTYIDNLLLWDEFALWWENDDLLELWKMLVDNDDRFKDYELIYERPGKWNNISYYKKRDFVRDTEIDDFITEQSDVDALFWSVAEAGSVC